MRKILAVLAVAFVSALPLQSASAQDNTLGGALIGGGIGAIVGGAATGKAGGAVAGGIIGAAAGAMIGSQMEPRRQGYYHYRGDCWRRWPDGSYHRVHYRYCR
jgi:outer membrane lipoprotein SlyB